MRIAMLAPIAWRTPPRHYGPWELVTSLLTEELVRIGIDVTLFATEDSITTAQLKAVCPRGYEDDPEIEPKVWECLHIAHCFENAEKFDLVHNQFDFLPLSYSNLLSTPILTTIHGFSSPKILTVYKRYNGLSHYVSISNADRSPDLTYKATIYHGVDIGTIKFHPSPESDYLVYFGRFHPDKGAKEAIEIARLCGKELIMAGVIQDTRYFERYVEPAVKSGEVRYIGSVGPDKRDDILGRAVALLHPINFNEPFGLSVVESMACGTPVIAFSRGSMPELIDHNKTGFLVQTVSEAVECVGRIGEIDRSTCRDVVEQRFTKERMAREYVRVYREILSRSS
ncbi:MAG: glycosyltransferase [Chitinivibrionales bacterium]|nr:glycosyltransferase [Chitinivibrionales bacterium]